MVRNDIALWVKFKMPDFCRGLNNRGIFMFSVSIMGFQVCPTSRCGQNLLRHCILVEKSNMAAICPRLTNQLIYMYLLDCIGAGSRFRCVALWVKSKMTGIFRG